MRKAAGTAPGMGAVPAALGFQRTPRGTCQGMVTEVMPWPTGTDRSIALVAVLMNTMSEPRFSGTARVLPSGLTAMLKGPAPTTMGVPVVLAVVSIGMTVSEFSAET